MNVSQHGSPSVSPASLLSLQLKLNNLTLDGHASCSVSHQRSDSTQRNRNRSLAVFPCVVLLYCGQTSVKQTASVKLSVSRQEINQRGSNCADWS